MKFVKIKFTSWRDAAAAPRAPVFQQQLDAWTTRLNALSAEIAHIKVEQARADSEELQSAFDRVTADLERMAAERTLLLSVERAAAEAETRAAKKHKKAGTVGYRVFGDAGDQVTQIVDQFGNDLHANAVYAFEVVDTDPPLPEWANKRTVVS